MFIAFRRFFIENDLKATRFAYFAIDSKHFEYSTESKLYLGQLNLNPSHCRAFLVHRHVMIEHENETKLSHPAKELHIITESLAKYIFFGGVPFATTDTIR